MSMRIVGIILLIALIALASAEELYIRTSQNQPLQQPHEDCSLLLSRYGYVQPTLEQYQLWRKTFVKYPGDQQVFLENAAVFTCDAIQQIIGLPSHEENDKTTLLYNAIHKYTYTINGTTYSFLLSPFAGTAQHDYHQLLHPNPISSHLQSIDITQPDRYITSDHRGLQHITQLPRAFDWREHGRVTRVKDQGPFGTCWAFSASGAIEGALAGIGLPTVDISVETSVECDNSADPATRQASCMYFGGWPAMTMKYHRSHQKGYRTWDEFPYAWENDEMKHGRPCMPHGYSKDLCGDHDDLYCKPETTKGQGPLDYCNPQSGAFYAQVDEIHLITANETTIQQALMTYGPLSIAINADNLNWYSSGVYYEEKCSTFLNHAVLLVGFGETDENVPYWIIKNTWSESWGEQGYYRLYRGSNMCGVADQAIGVTIKKA